ncbi:MAG TPA: type VI secretion system membrane subunit TssM [Roseiarcus sp.]|nr:type VI secretion system membrane subunit TssM [Roseiarcus sp.]
MTWAFWLWIALSVLGAVLLALLIWFGGPLISVADYTPLDGTGVRLTIILVVFLIVGAVIAWRVVKRLRAAAALEKAMTEAAQEDSDAPILKQKMEDALHTLRDSKSGGAALYDLPWYVIIGPPGAGKTTALVNSGLRFPLAVGGPKAVAGIGGTRYCDWWFTDQALLIDTAGRYTTQDSDAKADKRSWLAFLDLLRRNRPRQPINGVLVAISIADLLTLSAQEISGHADAIRRRLDELHEHLRISFPVYAVFTKMDLISGFTPYFADLDEAGRNVVWGATFQTASKTANTVTQVGEEFDLLVKRIFERMPERLQEEPDPRARVTLFGMPAQLTAIRKPIVEFLNRVFEPTRYQTTAALRGFYFTSGTQEGTPLDAVIGALQRSYGVESYGAAAHSGLGKSYFLHDLMTKVIFAEAGWVSVNLAAVRRAFAVRGAAFAAIGLAMAGVLGLWWVSFGANTSLIKATAAGFDNYALAAAPLIKQTTINDPDVRPVYELIGALPPLPYGYAHRDKATPLKDTFGLSERPRVQDASITAYQEALERLMRPRLILSLEQQIQKNINDPTYLYEALKVYRMLGGNAPFVDKELILDWFTHEWEERVFPGAPYAQGRALLRAHLEAMLDMDTGAKPKVSLNGPLIAEAQATLARLPVAQRAYALLKSQARNAMLEDWVASQRGGPDMALVFEAANGASLDTVRVPGFFTYNGFYKGLIDHMPTIAGALAKDTWVLGASGQQSAVQTQYDRLFPDILDLYRNDFIAAWNAAITNLALRPLLADRPKYLALSAASAPTSPIKQIFESIRTETALTRERAAPPAAAQPSEAQSDALKLAKRKAMQRLSAEAQEAVEIALKAQRRAGEAAPDTPGASIEAYFKPIQLLVDGDAGSRPIDALLANLNELYRQLTLAASNPAQSKRALEQVEVEVASLRSNVTRLPQPLAGMMAKVARDAAGDASNRTVAQLTDQMAQEVTAPCQRVVSNRYPFSRSERDAPLADFARIFAPNGVIDKFFSANLAALANTGSRTWSWRSGSNITRPLSVTTLRRFQQAAEIRDTFFPTGGTQPNLSFTVKPLTLSGEAQTATLAVNGANVVAQQGSAAPGALQWPGSGAGAASITMAPDMPDRKSTLERSGAWAFFRLVDAGAMIQRGSAVNVSFIVGGREASFEFTSGSLNNPLSLSALRHFECPNGL